MVADTSFREKSSSRYWPNRDRSWEPSLAVPGQARTMDSTITFQSRHNPNTAGNPNRSLGSGEQAAAAQSVVSGPKGLCNKSPEPRAPLPSVEKLRRPIQPGTQVPGYPTGLRRSQEGSTPGNSGRPSESVQSTSGVQAPGREQEPLSTSGFRPKRASHQINITAQERKIENPPARAPIRPAIARKPVPISTLPIEGRSPGLQLGTPPARAALSPTDRTQHAGQTANNRGLHSVEEEKRVATENATFLKTDPILSTSRNKPGSAATSLRGFASGATPGQPSRTTPNPETSHSLGNVSSGGSKSPSMPRTFAAGQGGSGLNPQGPSDMPKLVSTGPRVDVRGPVDPRFSNATARRDPTSRPMDGIRNQSATGTPGARLPGTQTSGGPQRFRDQGLNNPNPSKPMLQRGPLQYPTEGTINRRPTTTPRRTVPGITRNQGLNSPVYCNTAHSVQQRNPFVNGAQLPQRNTHLNPFPSRGSPNQMGLGQRPMPATLGTQGKHGPSFSLGLRGEINIGRSAKAAMAPIRNTGIHPVAVPPQRPIHLPVNHNGYHPVESQKHPIPHSIRHSGNHHGKSLHESPFHHPGHHPGHHHAKSPEPSEEHSDNHRDKHAEESSDQHSDNGKETPAAESPDHPNKHPDESPIESPESSKEPPLSHPDEPADGHTEVPVGRAETPIDDVGTSIHPSDPGLKDPTDAPHDEAPHAIDGHKDHGERDNNFDSHDSDPLYPSDDYKHERGHDRTSGAVFVGFPDMDNPFHDTDGFETVTNEHDSLDAMHDGNHDNINDDNITDNYPETPDDHNDNQFPSQGENEDEPFSTDHGWGENEAAGSLALNPGLENEDPLFPDEHESENEQFQDRDPFDIDNGHSLPSDVDDPFGDPQDGRENDWALDENHNEDNEESNFLPEMPDSGGIFDENGQADEDPDELFGEQALGTYDSERQSEVGHDEEPGDVEDLFQNSDGEIDGYAEDENVGEVRDSENFFEGSEDGQEDSNAYLESDPGLNHDFGSESVGDQGEEDETASGLGIDEFSAGENDFDDPNENEDENPYSDLGNQFGSDVGDQELDESFANDDVEEDTNDAVSENQDIDNLLEESGDEQHQFSDVDEGIGSDMGDNELQSDPELEDPLANDDFGEDIGDDGLEPDDQFDDPMAGMEDDGLDAVDDLDEPSADDAFEGGMEDDAYGVETGNDYDDSGTGDYDGGQVEDYGDDQADTGYDAVDMGYDGGGDAAYDDSYDARYE